LPTVRSDFICSLLCSWLFMRLRVVDTRGHLLCEVEAGESWTTRAVKDAVEAQTQIRRHEQWLCQDLLELPDSERIEDLLGDAEEAELTLVRPRAEWAEWHQQLEESGLNLAGAPDWVKAGRRLVLIAAVQNSAALSHAAEDVWSDHEFVLDAVEECPRVLHFVAETLWSDRDLVFSALQLARACDLDAARTAACRLVRHYPELAVETLHCPTGDSEALGIGTIGAGVSASAFAGYAVGGAMMDGALAAAGAAAVESTGALVGAGAIAGGGTLAFASFFGAIALPLLGGLAVNKLVPGIPASSFEIRLEKSRGTCKVKAAGVVWVTEEGWGNVRLYYYTNAEAAQEFASSWACARILHECAGFLRRRDDLREIAWEGPAWPRSTIRKAVEHLNCFRRLPPSCPDGFF